MSVSRALLLFGIVTLAGCAPPHSRVMSVSPSPGAETADRIAPVRVVFDRDMDPATINTNTFQVRGSNHGPYVGIVTYNALTRSALFVTAEAFAPGEQLNIALKDSIRSMSKKRLRAYSWSFHIEPPIVHVPTPFTLSELAPTAESTRVERLSEIRARFSASFDPFSIGPTTIRVSGERSGARTLQFGGVFAGGQELVVQTDRAFLAGERMTVAFGGGLRSIEAMPLTPQTHGFRVRNSASLDAPQPIATGAEPQAGGQLLFFDADQDGRDEWCVASPDGALELVEWAAGAVSTPLTIRAPSALVASVCGDFDADSHVDLAFLAATGDRLYLYRGGEDLAALAGVPTVVSWSGFDARGLSALHCDNDGVVDVFLVSNDANLGSRILFGSATGSPLVDSLALPTAQAVGTPASADWNNDFHVDLLFARADGAVQMMFGTGTRAFELGELITPNGTVCGLALGEFNGDTLPDAVLCMTSGLAGELLIAEGAGHFRVESVAADVFPEATIVVDTDGDGELDLLVSDVQSRPETRRLAGRGDGSFAPAEVFSGIPSARQLRVGDVQADGVLDFGVLLAAGGYQVLSSVPATPSIANRLYITDFNVRVGDPAVSFAVYADHAERMDGFTIVLGYDPAQLFVERLATSGGAAEAIGVELEIPQLFPLTGAAVVAAIFDFMPPFGGQFLAPATGEVLLRGDVRAQSGAQSGVTMFGPMDGIGSPPTDNLFVAVATSVWPELELAAVTVETGAPPPPNGLFVRGDANSSGTIDIADGTFVQAYLYQGGAAPACLDAADFNDDGFVNSADPVYLFSFLSVGGPAPPMPYPLAGGDPTGDALPICD
ncbi:MAG: FG-GAP-like repeat-containing protein [Planctomycetota bacterium]